jgi:hypothetical protein
MVLGLVVVLAVMGALVVVLNLNRMLEANRERIVGELSKGFGRPVRVGRIAVGFHRGLAAELDDLHVADDPAYSTDDFLVAERTYAVVRMGPLLRGRIRLRRIVVASPVVTIIRTAQGLNVDSLGRAPAPTVRPPSPPSGSTPAAAPAPIPPVAIALLNLEHGIVRYADRRAATPLETTISPLDVHLSDVSVTSPMRIEVDATVYGVPATTVRVRGTVGPVGDPPFAADVPIEQHVGVHGEHLEVKNLTITGTVRRGEAGLPIGNLHVAAPALRGGGVDVADLDVVLHARDGVASLERLSLAVFGGTVTGKGRVEHAGPTPGFAVEAAVRGMDVSQALAVRVPDTAARFHGRLDADWSGEARHGDGALVRKTLAGTGHVVVRDGTLVGVNVADSVLSGVSGMGGLVNLVPPRIRERYPDIFGSGDTRFDELASTVRLGGERLQIETLDVSARDWAVHGTGVVTFAQHVDLTATLVASERLTQDIVGAFAQARYLTDDAGRLAIPFRLAGVLPTLRPKPDEDFLGRVLRKAMTGEGLGRLFGGGKHAAAPSMEGKSKDGKPKDAKRKDGGNALQRGLDRLFGR